VNNRFVDFYFDVARRVAKLSRARRLQVGAVIVKDHRILSYGFNGTPSGFDNDCETLIPAGTEVDLDSRSYIEWPETLVTKPEVIHAEMNAILKVSRSHDSTEGATMFLTHSPCIECAKAILQSGIDAVYYDLDYRKNDGISLLLKGGLTVISNERWLNDRRARTDQSQTETSTEISTKNTQ
jgi:dCMP deaminase